MTHDEIADFAAMHIRKKGYPASFSNMTSVNQREQPDVLGISIGGVSFLGEVKVSRSDFLADKKKPFRIDGGIGDFRAYITPKGLLKPEEIPYGWSLWEVHGKTKPVMKIIKGEKLVKEQQGAFSGTVRTYPNMTSEEYNHFQKRWDEKSYRKELMWLIQIVRRCQDDGFEPNDYANKYQGA